MKGKKTLKSLVQLSAELLVAEVVSPEQAPPPQSTIPAEKLPPDPLSVQLLMDSNTRGYQRWGINE
jgi:hypothetical protein